MKKEHIDLVTEMFGVATRIVSEDTVEEINDIASLVQEASTIAYHSICRIMGIDPGVRALLTPEQERQIEIVVRANKFQRQPEKIGNKDLVSICNSHEANCDCGFCKEYFERVGYEL
jgi:hypothetical protein